MPSLEDEELVIRMLAAKGLKAVRFSKTERRQGKTPDFKVFNDEVLVFYCEVKSIEDDRWLEKKLETASPGQLVGGDRSDPVFNRLSDDIHTAAAQFSAVNPQVQVPNVLVFVNHDSICDEQDLAGVVTGKFLAEDGSAHRVYEKFSEGRIKDEKFEIGAYVWIEEERLRSVLFNQNDARHKDLCALLGYVSSSIPPITP